MSSVLPSQLQLIEKLRVVPVVVLEDDSHAASLAQAMMAGGLGIAEVTFRTAGAAKALAAMAQESDMLVGAGTVVTPEQVKQAKRAGATFIVSPGLREDVVKTCQDEQLPVLPGVANASDIMNAIALGLDVVKFFPAGVNGGAKAIKALAAPFPNIHFMPTGGVSESNLADYLSIPAVCAVGGSWMVPNSAVDAGDFAAITELCRGAVAAAAAC